jgi:Secretion system C-terminal sorting domain
MKKNLQFGKKIAFTMLLLVSATLVNAADRYLIATGNWNATSTWAATAAGAPGASVPVAGDNVFIQGTRTVTVTANAACTNITFANNTSFTGIVSLNSGITLDVSGTVTIPRAASGGAGFTNTFAVGAGILNAGSIAFTNDGTGVRHQLTISTGTANVSGNISTNASGSSATVSFSGAGLLQVGGSLFTTGGTVTVGTGTIEYDAAGAQTIKSLTYNNLKLSGSGAKTLAGTVNGTLTVAGSATTAGTISYGANGILKYNGSGAQTTTNVEFPAAMSGDVVIDNAAGVTLNAAKTLSGSLTLTNGVLTSTTTNLLRFADGFATVSGGSATSYVDGPVRKTGNDAFTFPVGKSGVYAPVTITAPDNNGDVFTVEYFRGLGSLTGAIDPAISANVSHQSTCEYWDIAETTDAGTATSVSVTVTWSANSGCNVSSSYITDVTKLTLLHYNTTTSKWDTYGGTASGTTTSGSILRTSVNTFSPFTLGSLSISANPLPVSFTDVKAFEKGAAVQIEWTNATESDMSTYVIERSSNGIDFTAIGQTAPRSNQFDRVSYTYIDAAPLAGTNFYRVKAIELSGKNVYTKSLRVDMGRSPKGISLYPNPVRGSVINIGFSAEKGQYSLNVLNTAGQVVYRQAMNHAGGTVAQSVTLPSSLKAGVYNVLISGDNFKETKMFVIQ